MCYKTFPDGYTFFDKIDLKNNKKQFWLVQGFGTAILLIMLIAGCFIVNPYYALVMSESVVEIIALLVILVGYLIYIVLHELTHGVVMYAFCHKKLRFGVSLTYAYCGSTAYYDKIHYIVIALAPVVIWGIVLGVLNVFFHSDAWFWVIWFIQAGNIGGAAGDFFCTYKMCRYPNDILVQDTGTEMTVFRRKTEEELQREENP